MYLFYRMGIFHVARGSTSMTRYHECVVFAACFRNLVVSVLSGKIQARKFWYYWLRISRLSLFLLSSAPSPFGPVGYFGGGAVASGPS